MLIILDKDDVTYKDILEQLNKIFKTKSKVPEVAQYKTILKNKIYAKITKKKGKVSPATLNKIRDTIEKYMNDMKKAVDNCKWNWREGGWVEYLSLD